MPAPAISVLVPGYGVSAMLGEAIASLQAQTREDWEAIVVDDGDPAVADAIAPFADDTRIRLLKTDNGGLAKARNRAAALAHAPLIALLDGDDTWLPDYIESMTAILAADADAAFACCDAIYFGTRARSGERFSAYTPQDEPATLKRVLRREFNVFVGATIRRAAFYAAGGFDPTLRSAEDLDLWIRLLAGGGRCHYLPTPLVRYRRRAGSLSANTLGLLGAELRVYEKAVASLAGRAEQVAARDGARIVAERLAFAEGEQLILEGDTRAGLRRLRSGGARARKPLWRATTLLLTALPMLGPPLMRRRLAADAPE